MSFTENVKSTVQKHKEKITLEAVANTAKELWSKRGSLKDNYVVDFVKSLLDLKKIPLVIYLLVDSFFVFIGLCTLFMLILSLGDSPNELPFGLIAFASFVIYFGTIIFSLSPLGEVILRFFNRAEEITSPEVLSRLEPIFNEVYAKAKANFPKEISKDIKLYIQHNEDPNAFAMGRNSVTVTSGLLELPDEQIKAILGHEFGHLAHKDTDLLLVMNITCKFVHLLFIGINILMFIYQLFVKVICLVAAAVLGEGIYSLMDKLLSIVLTVAQFIFVTLVEAIWNIIGNFLLSISSHEGEYKADEFAYNLGYGEHLIAFFQTLPDERTLGILERLKAMAIAGSTHPDTYKRIEYLKSLSKKSKPMMAAISESADSDFFKIISE